MAKRKAASKKSKPVRDASEVSEPASAASGPMRDGLPVPGHVVLEICKFAHPRDVFHLSRTSKSLRADLTGRVSASAWKQAFRNVEMPELPDDLAGHRYAALAFEAICDHCYKRCKMLKDTLWDLRTRVCVKCSYKPVALADVPASVHGLPNGQLRELVPTSKKPGFSYGKTSSLALRKVTDEIKEVVNDPAQLAQYVQTRKALVSALDAHARDVEDWDEKVVLARQESDALSERQSDVCERLKREGWGKQLSRTHECILAHPLVSQRRQLFDDDWATIKPELTNAAMAWWVTLRSENSARLQKIQRYRRWKMATYVLWRLERQKDDDEIWPDSNDLRRMPELQPMLNGQPVPDAVAQKDREARTVADQLAPSSASFQASEDEGPDHASFSDDALSAAESFIGLASTISDPSDCESYPEDATEEQRLSRRHHGHDRAARTDCAWCEAQKRDVEQAMTTDFPDAVKAWRRRITLELFDRIPIHVVKDAGVDLTSYDAKLAFLSRPSTAFLCDGTHEIFDSIGVCGGNPSQSDSVTYPAALEHRDICAVDAGTRFEFLENDNGDMEYQQLLRLYWKPTNLRLTFDEENCFLENSLFIQCELDPHRATGRDMDRIDARFVCRSCEGEAHKSIWILGWLSCLNSDKVDGKNYHALHHEPNWTRIACTAEESIRMRAPRPKPEGEPRAVALSELGMHYHELFEGDEVADR